MSEQPRFWSFYLESHLITANKQSGFTITNHSTTFVQPRKLFHKSEGADLAKRVVIPDFQLQHVSGRILHQELEGLIPDGVERLWNHLREQGGTIVSKQAKYDCGGRNSHRFLEAKYHDSQCSVAQSFSSNSNSSG
jgi:hypothetical protein